MPKGAPKQRAAFNERVWIATKKAIRPAPVRPVLLRHKYHLAKETRVVPLSKPFIPPPLRCDQSQYDATIALPLLVPGNWILLFIAPKHGIDRIWRYSRW